MGVRVIEVDIDGFKYRLIDRETLADALERWILAELKAMEKDTALPWGFEG